MTTTSGNIDSELMTFQLQSTSKHNNLHKKEKKSYLLDCTETFECIKMKRMGHMLVIQRSLAPSSVSKLNVFFKGWTKNYNQLVFIISTPAVNKMWHFTLLSSL